MVYPNYQLSADTPLPCKEAIMNNSNNKQEVSRELCASGRGPLHVKLNFGHEEADISIMTYQMADATK